VLSLYIRCLGIVLGITCIVYILLVRVIVFTGCMLGCMEMVGDNSMNSDDSVYISMEYIIL